MEDTLLNNKGRLFIIGANHLARELESWIELIPDDRRDWKFTGFLHNINDGNPLKQYPTDYKILGDWETFKFKKGDRCLIGVADVEWREKIFRTLENKVWFMPFIAPNAIIGKFNKISDGTIICPNTVITTNVKIGKGCLFNIGTQVGHDAEIGDFCSLMANVDLGGGSKVGRKVFIGTNSSILPKKKIADNVRIGAGSIVIKNVKKENVTLFGNPAVIIHDNLINS
jgi:sugar O-acyltransferase (sialic acid O-acetyltransferase NeuD family)